MISRGAADDARCADWLASGKQSRRLSSTIIGNGITKAVDNLADHGHAND